MSNLIIKYPLDLRGNSPNNRVDNETHTIPASEDKNRVIVPNYGPFYTEGLSVKETNSGATLEKGTQWKAVQLYQEAVQRTGKEVCAVIVITDASVPTDITIGYQVVGGKFSRAVPIIEQLIADLSIDEREVEWAELLATPDYFPPVSHMHDAGDLYGFEYVISALEQVREAILIGDEASHDAIRDQIEYQAQLASDARDQITSDLNNHIGDTSNPHNVTAAQVGLGNLPNYGVATQTQAKDPAVTNKLMTPQRTFDAIAAHSNSGDHDGRYVRQNATVNSSVKVEGSNVYIYANGAWRQVYPAQWS